MQIAITEKDRDIFMNSSNENILSYCLEKEVISERAFMALSLNGKREHIQSLGKLTLDIYKGIEDYE